jgi:hypothetical protein
MLFGKTKVKIMLKGFMPDLGRHLYPINSTSDFFVFFCFKLGLIDNVNIEEVPHDVGTQASVVAFSIPAILLPSCALA